MTKKRAHEESQNSANNESIGSFAIVVFFVVIILAIAGAGVDAFILSWMRDSPRGLPAAIFGADLLLGTFLGGLLLWRITKFAATPPSPSGGAIFLVLSGTAIGAVIGTVNGLLVMKAQQEVSLIFISGGFGLASGLVASLLAAIPFAKLLSRDSGKGRK